MKNRLFVLCSAALAAVCLYGCTIQQTGDSIGDSAVTGSSETAAPEESMPEFSSEYLVGTYYGGGDWGEFYDCLSERVIVCTDHRLLVFLPQVEMHQVTDYVQADTLTLTDAQYDAISSKLDREKLFRLDPEEDWEVCDGYTSTLVLYDTNQEPAKSCGGYMPQNDDFAEMYRAVMDNLPTDDLNRIRSEWIEELKKANT